MPDILSETKESIRQLIQKTDISTFESTIEKCAKICDVHNEKCMHYNDVPQIPNIFVSNDLSHAIISCLMPSGLIIKLRIDTRR